jgi:glycosyltransferase involved in cell wall biosynthesis
VKELGVGEVVFTGGTTFRELLAYFRNADVYLSMSDHEGFGVPLIEAMKLGLPVLGYAGGAVEETIGEGGIVFHERRYEDIAATVHRVTTDSALHASLVEAGLQRAAWFEPENHRDSLLELIRSAKP